MPPPSQVLDSLHNKTNDHRFPFGYCTNVHAGTDLLQAKANLQKIACDVRDRVVPEGKLPVGLWLAEPAARQLIEQNATREFREWLADHRLLPYTFNGFPQGDFHQSVVKHSVYEPDWRTTARRDYTCILADIFCELMPPGSVGSISTLPLGWPHQTWNKEDYSQCACNLRFVAQHLEQLFQRTGTEIVIALEPEPGCVLDTAIDLIAFFEEYLFADKCSPLARRHLTVCHDICHSAVMFEPQAEAIQAYADHGIRIGKVQVSSAVSADWSRVRALESSTQAREKMRAQLTQFNEPRYLHQTTRQRSGLSAGSSSASPSPNAIEMVDDLPIALSQWNGRLEQETEWRVHFHVPIFVNEFGSLRATQSDIPQVIAELQKRNTLQVEGTPWFTGHYEVETYAWGVLPPELQLESLADGIARELAYLRTIL